MPEMGCWQPWRGEGVQARPGPPVALTASAPRLTPSTPDGLAAYREPTASARHGSVSLVPPPQAFQPGARRRERPGQAPPPRGFDGVPCRAEPPSHRLAPDRQLPGPRLTASRRKPAHVDGRRCALSPPLTPCSRPAPTLEPPRRLRLQRQIDLAQTCPPCAPAPFGGVPVCAADAAVVGVPHDDALPPGGLTPPAVGPEVQDGRPVDVRRPGAHTAPLGCPFPRRVPWSCFPHARWPPCLPGAHDARVPHPRRDARHQPGVVDRLKAPTDVRLTHPVDVALLEAHRHGIQGSMGAAAGATSRGEAAPLPRGDGVQPRHRGPLDARIVQGRDAAWPLAAIRRRDGHPRDRAGVGRPAREAG